MMSHLGVINMPVIHRLKHNFTAGEISPLTSALVDFSRFKNSCLVMKNMMSIAQGPVTRRTGFEFLFDLTTLGLDVNNLQVRLIPFIHSEEFTYELVFFMHTDGIPRMVVAWNSGLILHGSTVRPCPPTRIETIAYTGPGAYNVDPANADVYLTNAYHVFHANTAGDGSVVELEMGPEPWNAHVDGDFWWELEDPTPPVTDHVLHITENVTSIPNSGELRLYKRNLNANPNEVVILELDGLDILNFDYAQSGDELHTAQGDLRPHIITRRGHYCWEWNELTVTAEPSVWTDTNGWPELVTFFQQRLVYACTTLKTHTCWVSYAGDYHNFTEDSSKARAFSFSINSETQNKIQWLLARRSLNLSTLGSEWTVTGATSFALTFENVLSERHTNNGSERIKPLSVNFATLFIERHGRNVNEFVYDYTFDSYKVNDLSILAPHLTENFSIISWAYQQAPYSIIWAVLSDGTMIALTYQRDQKVVGWHRHDTDGTFLDVGVRPSKDHREDEVFVCVQRDDRVYLERKSTEFNGVDRIYATYGKFLDSYQTYDGSPVNTVTGLDRLEGKVVDILTDGAVHPQRTVVGGAISLNAEYSVITVGLPYVSEIRPTVHDIGLPDGTAQGRMQRVINIDVNFYKSLGCSLGRSDQEDGDFEEDIPFRVPGDLMGQPVPLFNGIKHLSFPEGYDRKAEYFIKQIQPLPMTVLSVIDVVEVGD